MASIVVSFVGNLDSPAPGGASEVSDDLHYVHACNTVREAIETDSPLEIWVRTPHHFAWLKDYLSQVRVDAAFTEKTARTILAEKWNVSIPDWVSEDHILSNKLLDLISDVTHSGQFESVLVSHLLGLDVTRDIPNGDIIGQLVTALCDEEYGAVRERYPIITEAITRLSARWQEMEIAVWMTTVLKRLPHEVETVWRWFTASLLLGKYPRKLLERVVPSGQVTAVRAIPATVAASVPLEPTTRDEARTQVRLLFKEIEPKVSSSAEFRKILDCVSGKINEEIAFVESLLRNGKFEPTADDISQAQHVFQGASAAQKQRVAAFNHVVRPDYPEMPTIEEQWSWQEWTRWTIDQYAPYREWQVRNARYDAQIEESVGVFSDWYIQNYAALQADPGRGLVHAFTKTSRFSDSGQLTVVLMIDCLPISYFSILEKTLRSVGMKRQKLSYRFAGLPTITEYNKGAVIAGKPGPRSKAYETLLKERAEHDWNGIHTYYVSTPKELAALHPGQSGGIILYNHLEGDEILHSDVDSKNRTYEEDLERSYTPVAEALLQVLDRWPGLREKVSVLLVTDHGACRVLDEEGKTFDSTVVSKLFGDEKHRVATMTPEQADKVPPNLWELGYRFTDPLSEDVNVHFLPRGHNTVRRAGSRLGYVHGGVTPEEVIVPFAIFGLTAVPVQKPFIRFIGSERSTADAGHSFYVQRLLSLRLEVQNPNVNTMNVTHLEIVSPTASVKEVKLGDVESTAVRTIAFDVTFEKSALEATELQLLLRYSVDGEEYDTTVGVPAEFKSAMSGGFSLKDL